MSKHKHCEHCGASMVEYKRGFNVGLARCIYQISRRGGINVDVSQMGLSNSEYSNFGRLRFWGLVEQDRNFDNKAKGGVWSMTEKGWEFAKGNIEIPKYVMTYRGVVVEELPEMVAIQDVTDGWWYKPKVIAESRPHGG